MTNLEGPRSPENERSREQILGVLEAAFERESQARLTVSEPSGAIATNDVFIEGCDGKFAYVAISKESAVQGINIDDIKDAELINEKEN